MSEKNQKKSSEKIQDSKPEINPAMIDDVLANCRSFLDLMDDLSVQGAGTILNGSVCSGMEKILKEGESFNSENVYKVLQDIAEKGINGSREEFEKAYTALIIASHMLFAIIEYDKFLMWAGENDSSVDGSI